MKNFRKIVIFFLIVFILAAAYYAPAQDDENPIAEEVFFTFEEESLEVYGNCFTMSGVITEMTLLAWPENVFLTSSNSGLGQNFCSLIGEVDTSELEPEVR
jgi:hypothetical protein